MADVQPATASFGAVPVYRPYFNETTNTTALECDMGGGGSSLVMLGIAIGLVSSILINLGQNLQSIGGKQPGAEENPCSSRTWVVGLTTFAVGALGNMLAMAFASATILVPLESSQFVTNVFFSLVVNKVMVTRRQWCGTVLSVLGTTLICIFGPNDQRCFLLSDFVEFWGSPLWIGWVALTFSMSAFGWMWYARLLRRFPKAAETERRGSERIATVAVERPKWAEAALPALFAVSSALVGGAQMIVHTKALAEIFDMWFAGQFDAAELFSEPIFWVELMLTVGCGAFWLRQMNDSIVMYEPLFIIPLLQASYITFGATASGIFYQEFGTLAQGPAGPVGTWVIFVGGIWMIVVGILLLAPPASFSGCDAGPCLNTRRRSSSMRLHMIAHCASATGGSKSTGVRADNGEADRGADLQVSKL